MNYYECDGYRVLCADGRPMLVVGAVVCQILNPIAERIRDIAAVERAWVQSADSSVNEGRI